MIDFDKMTVAEHEEYKEMQAKAQAFDQVLESYNHYRRIDYKVSTIKGVGMDVMGIVGEYKRERTD